MIDLTPIDKRIQKKLFQKMRLLGRDGNAPGKTINVGGLTHNQLAVRSSFIRMTSGLDNPVILMGGELIEETSADFLSTTSKIAAGYNEIYGPRNYISTDVDDNFKILGENKFKRPMPGVKSIDVNFKGGVRALREATISWTCWSFDDINRLSPHFLSHGKTIALEWGWVYDKNTLQNLPSIINKNGFKKSAYTSYKEEVLKANGDFDYMIGIVKNFEYTTREDGAFDCQTIITSVGASIMSNNTPNQNSENTSVITKLTKQQELEELKELVKQEDEEIINFDVGVSLKSFIAYIDNYIRSSARDGKDKTVKTIPVHEGDTKRFITYEPNKFITEGATDYGIQSNVWVRWGWFEDNILSKFLTLISDNPQRQFVTQFRSVEKTDDGFESTRVRTHKRLETVDINKFILPGKFKTFDLADKQQRIGTDLIGVTRIIDRGDRELHHQLSKIINENFKSFESENKKYGRMRNFLINTKILRDAFGVSRDEVTTESINLRESLENLLTDMNQDIPFWSFDIVSDNEDDFRTKIIDNTQTAVTFEPNKKINININSDIGTKSIYNPNTDEVTNNGVFFFPVWQSDSIVKRQNITTKIPDAFAISTMYGANYDSVKFLDNPPTEASSLESAALAGAYASVEDKNLKNIDIALRKEGYETIGQTDDTQEITKKGGTDNVFSFLKRVSSTIKEKYEDKIKKINTQLNNEKKTKAEKQQAEEEAKIRELELELNQPFPTPDSLRDNPETTDKFNQLIENGYFQDVYDRKFYDDGKMKQSFIDFISDSVSLTPSNNNAENVKPLLIPMDMELEIDGIGGIVPGNSYHSTYLPSRYQEEALFQVFDIGHKIDSSGWSVTISGVMRSSFSKLTQTNKTVDLKEITDDLFRLKDNAAKVEAANEEKKRKESEASFSRQFEIVNKNKVVRY